MFSSVWGHNLLKELRSILVASLILVIECGDERHCRNTSRKSHSQTDQDFFSNMEAYEIQAMNETARSLQVTTQKPTE
jgi:hypothetical protein